MSANSDPFLLTGGAAVLALWNPIPSIGGTVVIEGGGEGGTQPDWLQNLYRLYQRKLARCIWKIFGKDANKLSWQTLRNAPRVDTDVSGKELGRRAGDEGLIVGWNKPNLGPYGTVYIASEVAASKDPRINPTNLYHTFVHELGNILDGKLNPHSPPEKYEANYGNPNAYDPDTGKALEDCVFGP